MGATSQWITVRGARTHNLKNVDVRIPLQAVTVITGVSGSGKSSLAFDTIFAEGQRRYVESLSASARQFVAQLPKAPVEAIDGLSPTVAIDAQAGAFSVRSTVGTATEIYDHLRLLYARCGAVHCADCGAPVRAVTVDEMVDAVFAALPPESRFSVLAPLPRADWETPKALAATAARLRKEGFVRLDVDGTQHLLDEMKKVRATEDVSLYVDRLVCRPAARSRLADSIELALAKSGGVVRIAPADGDPMHFATTHACVACGRSAPTLTPAHFSFNSPQGACPTCDGLGWVSAFTEESVVPDPDKSLRQGALAPWSGKNARHYAPLLDAAVAALGIDPHVPWKQLPELHRRQLLYGSDTEVVFWSGSASKKTRYARPFEGVIPNLERRRAEHARGGDAAGAAWWEQMAAFTQRTTCPDCGGSRLRVESRHVFLDGQSIDALCSRPLEEVRAFFDTYRAAPRVAAVAEQLVPAVCRRLDFLVQVGLGYLSLNRSMDSVSSGEAQRIRLATQLGSGLVGITYVLDEPSRGLHAEDTQRLWNTVEALVARGNTVIAVEHDVDLVRRADYVVDMGPGPGTYGGRVVACGTVEAVCGHPESLTGDYVSGRRKVGRRRAARTAVHNLSVYGARANNLRDVDVAFPLGCFVCVTGVSGSGKSSLVMDTLFPAVQHALRHGQTAAPAGAPWRRLEGTAGRVARVASVTQAPIGATVRSNPATFTGVFAPIRAVFAATPEAKQRGFSAGRFSFNVRGGRCEACAGDGVRRISMQFLPDVYVPCDVCGGTRFGRETLEVRYKGHTIADVLAMEVTAAKDLFAAHRTIRDKLDALDQVGLGYLQLGQAAPTLSGGEAQRLKLAKELGGRSAAGALFLLDEPTVGLHPHDVSLLLAACDKLLDKGASIVAVEHNLDVIAQADWIIELGPGGGGAGGAVVAQGTPESVAGCDTPTGRALASRLR